MWSDVQRELAEILSSRLFPVLQSDPGYLVMLRNAGLTTIPDYQDGQVDASFSQAQKNWALSIPLRPQLKLHNSVANLPPAIRSQLETAARMCSQLAVMHVEGLRALEERHAEAMVLDRPLTIYRLWDADDDNRLRNWWFSGHLLHEAQRSSAAVNLTPQEWLRDALAISLNFGKCNRLSSLTIGDRVSLPAVEARGLPMSHYSRLGGRLSPNDPRVDAHGTVTPDYWRRLGQTFAGQKTQYFLPFVPPDRIHDVPW